MLDEFASPEAVITLPDPDVEAPALIGVDWGTSNVRVMRLAAGGRILDQRRDTRGAGELRPDDFPRVLDEIAAGWMDGAPVLVCGMAGARGRWREVPYIPCPAGVAELAAGLVQPEPARELFIVPGVAAMGVEGLSDVMRGEETQVMGLDPLDPGGWVVAPGTHSKWVRVECGTIVSFRTFATGELFAALGGSTLLEAGAPSGNPRDDTAFRLGVERSLAEPALSAALFSARVEVLAGRLPAASASDYLSGVLIGAEVAAQREAFESAPPRLVGAAELCRRYDMALGLAGAGPAETCIADAVTARGLWRIWKARP